MENWKERYEELSRRYLDLLDRLVCHQGDTLTFEWTEQELNLQRLLMKERYERISNLIKE